MNEDFEKAFNEVFGDMKAKRTESEALADKVDAFLKDGGRVQRAPQLSTVAQVKALYPRMKADILNGVRNDHKTMAKGAYVAKEKDNEA